MDHVWHVVIRQESFQEGLCRLRIPPIVQEKIHHRAGGIDSPPQPAFLAPDLNADLVQEPPGTPSGFPVPQFFGDEGGELDVPLRQTPETCVYTACTASGRRLEVSA